MVTNTVEGKDILTNTIFGGLVSGVATGLVLALIFWIYNEQKRRSERKEQIRHLSSIISTHKKRM